MSDPAQGELPSRWPQANNRIMSDRTQEAPAEPRTPDEQSLVAAMREVVAELHPHLGARAGITLDSSLDRDLGLDSLSRMELLSRLERRFGVTIPEAVMANAETARELLPALRAGERRRRSPAATGADGVVHGPETAGGGEAVRDLGTALGVEAIRDREPAHVGSEAAGGSGTAPSSTMGPAAVGRDAGEQSGTVRLSTAGSKAVETSEAADAIPTAASTLLEAVDFHARRHGDRVHVELYGSAGAPEGAPEGEPARITFAALVERAEHLAAGLANRGLVPGQSAALMLPTGLDYLATFLAVQMAGAIPVPIYPPARPSQLEDHVRRHAGILANARARTLVTFGPALGVSRLLTAQVPGLDSVLDVAGLDKAGRLRERPALDESSTAFLQYTSGSTGSPKGVVLSHGDVLASLKAMAAALGATPRDVFVSWLPLYHDMGLIGAWMGSLYYGFPLVLMSPLDFLARPARWLEAIHRHRGTLSGGPNFAYELCVRRIEPDQMEGLDLSSWRLAFNGAEPVSPGTMDRFTAKFVPCGLPGKAMTPVYGLAEATLGVAFTPVGRGPRIDVVDAEAIARRGRAAPLPGGTAADGTPADGPSVAGPSAGGRQAGGSPAGGSHVAEPPAEGRLAGGSPAGEPSVAGPPAEERQAGGSPAGRPHVVEPPAEGRPAGGSPVGGPAGRVRRFVSCGPPIPGFEVRIVDDRGTEIEERAEGAVEFRGPSTTSGYFRNPAANRALFDGDWLRSGDRGYVAGGELYVTGRDKDLIVRAGRNLYPYDLEAAVGGIDGVRKGCVAVFASPDPVAGTERLVVVAETREEDPERKRGIEEAIVRAAAAQLGSGPDEVVLAPPHSVLKTSSGKIRRVAVRELFESGALKRGAGSVRMQVARLALAAARGTARSWARRAARAAYTVYAGVVAAVTFGLAWLVVVMAPGSERARWRRGRVLCRAAFRALGIRIRVSGAANLERGGRYVVVANHASYLDGPLLFAAIPAQVGYVIKGELAGNAFLAPLLRALGAEFVNRLDHERSVADAASLADRLARGGSLGFFPEGTLHRMPGLLPFRLGAFSVAVEGGARVVPVTIAGSRSVMRDGQWIPRPGPVSVRIAAPIAPPPAAPPVTPDHGPVDEPGDEPDAAPIPDPAGGPPSHGPADGPSREPADGPSRQPAAEASHGPADEPGDELTVGFGRGSADAAGRSPATGPGHEWAAAPSPGPADGSSGEPPDGSSWARAVKLRDAARAVILAQCGEPDLGTRLDVLDALRRRKREEGME